MTLTVFDLLHRLCRVLRTTVDEMLTQGRGRTIGVSKKRWTCCFALHHGVGLGWSEIGQILKMHHSSVIFAVRRVVSDMDLLMDAIGALVQVAENYEGEQVRELA